MKKYILLAVLLTFLWVPSAKAATNEELLAQIQALTKQVEQLQQLLVLVQQVESLQRQLAEVQASQATITTQVAQNTQAVQQIAETVQTQPAQQTQTTQPAEPVFGSTEPTPVSHKLTGKVELVQGSCGINDNSFGVEPGTYPMYRVSASYPNRYSTITFSTESIGLFNGVGTDGIRNPAHSITYLSNNNGQPTGSGASVIFCSSSTPITFTITAPDDSITVTTQ